MYHYLLAFLLCSPMFHLRPSKIPLNSCFLWNFRHETRSIFGLEKFLITNSADQTCPTSGIQSPVWCSIWWSRLAKYIEHWERRSQGFSTTGLQSGDENISHKWIPLTSRRKRQKIPLLHWSSGEHRTYCYAWWSRVCGGFPTHGRCYGKIDG